MSNAAELERIVWTLYDTKDQLKRHVFDRADQAFEAGDRARDAIADWPGLLRRKEGMKRAFLEAVGGIPPTGGPLHASTVRVEQGEGYRVENVVFQSRPGHYVTSNVYVPVGRKAPGPAVLFLPGHEFEGKHSPYYHRVCLTFVRRGLLVMAIDPLGQGERLGHVRSEREELRGLWGTREHQRLGVQCYAAGDSVARYFVHDAMRAVDYLCEREDVDPLRIGVTGNSGGGTQTAMMMVCDERIAAAAPATFIMNRKQYMHAGGVQDAEQVWPGLTALGYDHEDVLLSFAPKPLLVLAAEYDFFPIEATRRTVGRCLRFWELGGNPGGLRLATDRWTHRYTNVLAEEAAQFFADALKLREAGTGTACPPLDSERLLCTESGQVLLDRPEGLTVREENIARVRELARARAMLPEAERRDRALAWLREKVFGRRVPCGFHVRRAPAGEADGLGAEYLLWWSQEGLMNSGYLFRDVSGQAGIGSAPGSGPSSAERRPFTVAVWPGGTTRLTERWERIRAACAAGRSVLVLNASGVGPHEPHPLYNRPSQAFFGITHKLADELLWLGDSLAALRAYDILRCLDMIDSLDERRQDTSVELFATGYSAASAVIAAALDARIGQVEADVPFRTYAVWAAAEHFDEEDAMSAVLPGILAYCDLDELAEWKGFAGREGGER